MSYSGLIHNTKEPYLEEPYEEPNIDELKGLEKLKQEELLHYRKLEDRDYYNTKESRDKGQEIQQRKKRIFKKQS